GASQAGGFIGAVGLFALSYIGITISLFPMIVPHHYTLTQAASPPGTQAFLLVGTLFLLPVILFYSGCAYWVFREKVRSDIGYHLKSAVADASRTDRKRVVIVVSGFAGLAAELKQFSNYLDAPLPTGIARRGRAPLSDGTTPSSRARRRS